MYGRHCNLTVINFFTPRLDYFKFEAEDGVGNFTFHTDIYNFGHFFTGNGYGAIPGNGYVEMFMNISLTLRYLSIGSQKICI